MEFGDKVYSYLEDDEAIANKNRVAELEAALEKILAMESTTPGVHLRLEQIKEIARKALGKNK